MLKFDRSGFKPCGPLELASMELIKMAAAGNFLHVEELLNCGTVHPDVADKQGHSALIGATVSCVVVVHHFYIALYSTFEQISCTHM